MERDYTQGFGSFYFASDRVREEIRTRSKESNERLLGVPRNTKRTVNKKMPRTPFRLMKLPLEVRRQILANITDSVAGTHSDAFSETISTQGIHFYLVDPTLDEEAPESADMEVLAINEPVDQRNRDHRTQGSDFTRVDLFDMYKRIRSGEFNEDPNLPDTWKALRNVSSDYDSSESEAEFTDGGGSESDDDNDEEPDDLGSECAPEATTIVPRYIVAVSERRQTDESCEEHHLEISERAGLSLKQLVWPRCDCKRRAVSEYNDVEALSKVSRQITQELGSLMWGSATLHVTSPEIFFPFASERPAALACLKSMIVTLDCSGYLLDTDTTVLKAMLEFVSEKMTLSFLGVSLYLWDEVETTQVDYEKDDSITATKLREWAPFFKKVRVGKFMLRFAHYQRGRNVVSSTAEVQRAEGQIEKMWMPEALALQDEGDVAAYLRNRNA